MFLSPFYRCSQDADAGLCGRHWGVTRSGSHAELYGGQTLFTYPNSEKHACMSISPQETNAQKFHHEEMHTIKFTLRARQVLTEQPVHPDHWWLHRVWPGLRPGQMTAAHHAASVRALCSLPPCAHRPLKLNIKYSATQIWCFKH